MRVNLSVTRPKIGRRFARAWSILRELGPRDFATRLLNKTRLALGLGSAAQRDYVSRKAAVDAAFDRDAGADTGGIQHLYDLSIVGANAGFGTSHIASDPDEFAAAMTAIGGDLSALTFVDLGSGKGRALLMAADYPFACLVGVEFAAELHAIATANLAARADCERFELVHGDVVAYDFPDTPLVLFLFNPFDAPVVAEVARRAMASWRRRPRPITVLYVNPLQAAAWREAGWRERERHGAHAVFEPA